MLTTEQQASDRVETFLSTALHVLAGHRQHQADDRLRPHAWSATYLCLSKLLGAEFTKQLKLAGTPCCRFRYTAAYGDGAGAQVRPRTDGDHVVPMRALLEHLITLPADSMRVADLRAFLQQHIVMAEISDNLRQALDKTLRHVMPPQGQGWQGEVREPAVWRSLWSRYEATGIEPPPLAGPSNLWIEC